MGAYRLALALGLALLVACGTAGQEKKPSGKPDLIVADASVDGDTLVLVIQNQGPGSAQKKTTVLVEVEVRELGKAKGVPVAEKVPVPVDPAEVTEARVPLKKFGIADAKKSGVFVTVALDRDNRVAEERERNNDFYHQIDGSVPKPRGDFRNGKGLPDLVLTDITAEGPYFYFHYKNQGDGVTGADFLIRSRQGGRVFDGNRYYRFRVPAPGEEAKTGGFTHNLPPGTEVEVEAAIDHEDRVRESDEKNNTFKKKVKVPEKN